MRATITERTLKMKPPTSGTIEIWDTVVPGLALRVHAGGRRSYCVTTRVHGRQVRRTIGTVDTHKLAEARDAARDVLRDAAKGIDSASPEAKGRAAVEARRAAERASLSSFRAVAETYLDDTGKGGGARLRSCDELRKMLERDVFPAWGDRPIAEIKRADVRDLIEGIAKGRPIAGNRALAAVRRIFNWSLSKDRLDTSPAAGIEAPSEENNRDRVLSDAEIAQLWPAFDQIGYPFSTVLKLLLLTGQRRREVGGMRWNELDGDMWTLPAERSKNKRAHRVPLSAAARDLIADVPRIDGNTCVFTSGKARTRNGGTGEREIDRPVSGWGAAKKRLDLIVAKAAAEAAGEKLDMAKHALPHWTIHDLRRTMDTQMNDKLGIEPHVVEAIINHVSGAAKAGQAGTYNRAQYLPQRRAALEAWARYLGTLIGGKPVSNIVALRAGA